MIDELDVILKPAKNWRFSCSKPNQQHDEQQLDSLSKARKMNISWLEVRGKIETTGELEIIRGNETSRTLMITRRIETKQELEIRSIIETI